MLTDLRRCGCGPHQARAKVFRAKWSEVGIPTLVGERSRNSDLGGKNSVMLRSSSSTRSCGGPAPAELRSRSLQRTVLLIILVEVLDETPISGRLRGKPRFRVPHPGENPNLDKNLDKELGQILSRVSSCRATCPSLPKKLEQGTWTTAGFFIRLK